MKLIADCCSSDYTDKSIENNQGIAGMVLISATASNLEQVTNLLDT